MNFCDAVDFELAKRGLRRAVGNEAGWYVAVVIAGTTHQILVVNDK